MKTDEDPVTANTIKMLMNSHLYFTFHLFSNFLKMNRTSFSNKKKIPTLKAKLKAIWESFKNIEDKRKAENPKPAIPIKGKISCQFLLISQRSFNLFTFAICLQKYKKQIKFEG